MDIYVPDKENLKFVLNERIIGVFGDEVSHHRKQVGDCRISVYKNLSKRQRTEDPDEKVNIIARNTWFLSQEPEESAVYSRLTSLYINKSKYAVEIRLHFSKKELRLVSYQGALITDCELGILSS